LFYLKKGENAGEKFITGKTSFAFCLGPPHDILPIYGAKDEAYDASFEVASASTSFQSLRTLRSPGSMDSNALSDGESSDNPNQSMTKSSHSFELTSNAQVDDNSCDLNEENQREGTIQFHVFHSYYKAVGPFLFWTIIVSLALMQASKNFSDLWLAYWVSHTNSSDSGGNSTEPPTLPPTFETILLNESLRDLSTATSTYYPDEYAYMNESDESSYFKTFVIEVVEKIIPLLKDLDPDVKYYFSIFILIGLVNSVLTLARAFLFALGGILGALKIHSALLQSILKVCVLIKLFNLVLDNLTF
jgi:hypothetical protein